MQSLPPHLPYAFDLYLWFLQDQNIVLYRRLRNSSTGEVERRMIITLLRGEMAKLKISKDEPQQFKLGKSVRRQKQTRERNATG
jgi:hypothetical protein